ncbi:hypothetical protein Tco_0388724 [Tanacetum coccineum]
MLLAMKDEAGSNLNNEENDFMLDTLYGEETMEELTAAVLFDGSNSSVMISVTVPIIDANEKLSSHDLIVYKMGQSIQIIHMLRKTPNKVYDPFLKSGLGYKNPERLKKAIAAHQKCYGEMLHSVYFENLIEIKQNSLKKLKEM